ncbi:Bug family tripartite tricarboxylate transporter substrate binding protein [Chelativorans salis]|uniref:Tripartite tricarboxylate transporter substrate binding protein n=1 Tax=Chelativorans salis TaxID=2978478 RepID=A0ABT2LX12_9HYPH|nr:tripartite tricarboxylate transporter substrate binding protein [Chelativorans sp. EGI FJ00035]MCT7378133.1 tripartite tricarboxylate transporter substrate binding protein [Chelativorans sp. EGI FJ00035]
MKRIVRRTVLAWPLALAMTAQLTGTAGAQNYPNDTITFVVGFSAGGFADSVARIMAEHVGSVLGATVIVENQAGAASNIAARAVASAEPDGYTVLVSTTSLAINATMFRNIDYNLMEDLIPVGIAVRAPETLSVYPGRAASLEKFMASEGTYSSAGVGSGSYFTWYSFFESVDGANVVHVPFQGGAPATQAAIGGQVDALAATASGNTVSNVTSGQLDCLAVAAPERYSKLPDCPTLEELGYPNHYGSSWVGFWVPAGTPDDIVETLNEAINSIAENANAAENLMRHGNLAGMNAADTLDFMQSEVDTWGERVIATDAQIE